jgi:glycosyltransferase involved in cell wall biosynthesis
MALPRLVQPLSNGRLSGGFLYNAKMAEHGAWEICDVVAADLAELVDGLPAARLVVLDSIWLTPETVEPFFRLAARGGRVAVMLHSFPSMITAAESGAAPRCQPSDFECQAIARLGLVVVPGRHYEAPLQACGAEIVVSEPGIEDAWRTAPRRRSGPCRLVSVGAVTPRKGFLDVAQVLVQRSPADFRWTVIGSLDVDPEYAARVAETVKGCEHIELVGQLAPSEVRRLVALSDVLVMPSYDENQPLVLLESMAASVPAVAYAAGAARHMLEHGREGLIAPIGDKLLLAAHLRRLIEDEAERHTMAVACWKRQSSLRNWSDAARRCRAALEAAGV